MVFWSHSEFNYNPMIVLCVNYCHEFGTDYELGIKGPEYLEIISRVK